MSLISLLDITSVTDGKIFLWITAFAAGAGVVNPTSINILFANNRSTFFNNGKSTNSNGSKSLPRNLPDSNILYI